MTSSKGIRLCDQTSLGVTKLVNNEIEVKVHPMLIPEQHPLATVRDSFNAVFVRREACDDAMRSWDAVQERCRRPALSW